MLNVGFCMIVRDGADTLPACLRSVVHLVDEMIVVDTGSTDDSVAIARSFGARVVQIAWPDDFSKARNTYLRVARCPWILSLDADETIDIDRDALHALISPRRPAAVVFTVRNYFPMSEPHWWLAPSEFGGAARPGVGWTPSRTVRLFPHRRGVEYRYPVHESLVPMLTRHAIRRCRSTVPIHHVGYLQQADRSAAKGAMYRELGLKKLAQYPRHFLGYLELGKLLLREGDLENAARLFHRCLRLHPLCAKAYYCAAFTALKRGDHAGARRLLALGQRLFRRNADLMYLRSLIELEDGRPIESVTSLAAAMKRAPQLAVLQRHTFSEASHHG